MNLVEAKKLLKKNGYRLIREAAGNTYVVYEYSGSTPDWAYVREVTSDKDKIVNALYNFICYGPDDITYCGILKPTSEETAKFRKLAGKDLEHDPEGVKFLMDIVDKYDHPYEISGDYMYDLGFDLYDDNGDPTMDFDSPEFTKILKDYAEQSVDEAIANL
jgi:hypothetical protein